MQKIMYDKVGKMDGNFVGDIFKDLHEKLFWSPNHFILNILEIQKELRTIKPQFTKRITSKELSSCIGIFVNYLNDVSDVQLICNNFNVIPVCNYNGDLFKTKGRHVSFTLRIDNKIEKTKELKHSGKLKWLNRSVNIKIPIRLLQSITAGISLVRSTEVETEPVSEFSKINDYLDGLAERIDNKINPDVDDESNKFYLILRGFIEHEKEQNEECSLFPSTLDKIQNKIHIKLVHHFLDLSDKLVIRNSQIVASYKSPDMLSQNEDYIDDLCKNAIHTQLHLFSVFQKQDKNYEITPFVKHYNQITVLTKSFIENHSHLPMYHSDFDIIREIYLTLIGRYIKYQERFQSELANEVYRYVIDSEVFEPKIADIRHLNVTLGVDHRVENGILFEDFIMDYITDFVNGTDSIFHSDNNIESELIARISQMITWSSSNDNPSANRNSLNKLYEFSQWKSSMYLEILGARRYGVRGNKFQKYINSYELISDLIVTYVDINDTDLEFLREFYIRILLRYMIDLDAAHGFDSSKIQNEMEVIIAKINPSHLFPIEIGKVRSIVYSMVVKDILKDASKRENMHKDFDGDSQIIKLPNNSMILHENVESSSTKVDFKFNPTNENRQWIDEIYEFGTKMKTAQLGEELNDEGDIFIGDILDGLKARRHAINSLFITHNMNVDLHNLDLFIEIIKEMNKYFTFATEETDKLINRTERLIFMVISHEAIFIK